MEPDKKKPTQDPKADPPQKEIKEKPETPPEEKPIKEPEVQPTLPDPEFPNKENIPPVRSIAEWRYW